jgi:Spy/CpxP family protein refolding chaperone
MGALLTCPLLAQPAPSANTPPSGPPPGGGHHDMAFLTDAEKQELHKAHEAAVAANPTLGTQEKDLMDQMKTAHDSGEQPSDDLKAKMHALRDKMDAAMIKADANVAPIIAKMKAHHGHGGPGGPPPSDK